jgi:hypothetical protein
MIFILALRCCTPGATILYARYAARCRRDKLIIVTAAILILDIIIFRVSLETIYADSL